MKFNEAKRRVEKKAELIEKAERQLKELEKKDPEEAKKLKETFDDLVEIACTGP